MGQKAVLLQQCGGGRHGFDHGPAGKRCRHSTRTAAFGAGRGFGLGCRGTAFTMALRVGMG